MKDKASFTLVVLVIVGFVLAKVFDYRDKVNPVNALKRHFEVREKPGEPRAREWSNLKYDVKKTDSLVTPYTGTVEVTLISAVFNYATNEPGTFSVMYVVRLGYSENVWRIEHLQASTGSDFQTFAPGNDKSGFFESFKDYGGF